MKLIISHMRLFMIISYLINYRFLNNHQSKPLDIFILVEKTVVYIINRKIHGCLERPDLFLVLNMKFLTVRYDTHVQHSK